jgi:hypothetical protein
MKNLKGLFVVALIVVGFSANAQFKFGFGGGVNLANLAGSDISGNENLMGFNGGVMMEVKLPVKIGFEADVLFSTKGATIENTLFGNNVGFTITNSQGDVIDDTSIKLSYIDLPVVVKIYMAKVLSFQFGAQYSMLISGKQAGIDIKDGLKSSDMSAVLGLGLDVLKIHASARYNYGLTSIYESGSDVKNNMLTLSVGIWIK